MSNQITCAEYKCRPYREMLTYKPLTNTAVQEELIKYLPNKQKLKMIKSNKITTRLFIGGSGTESMGTG